MILVHLKGGLGNQLFQYALGRKLAIKRGSELALDLRELSTERVPGDTYRPYAIGEFDIAARIATKEEVNRIAYPYGSFSRAARFVLKKVFRQFHLGYEPAVLERTGDVYLEGFWQSYRYSDSITQELRKELRPRAISETLRTWIDGVTREESVFLHVRRTDYVSDPRALAINGTCSVSYYEKAIERMTSLVPNASWYIFSDDIAWAKANLSHLAAPTFIEDSGLSDAESLFLMSSCKHAIIANSTFSWWGAWLMENPEKIVIAPTPWSEIGKPSETDLIPSSWISLPKN